MTLDNIICNIMIITNITNSMKGSNMGKENVADLKKRIIEEMTVDYASALEKNFDLAKQFVRIMKDGKVYVQFREKLTGKQQMLLYLIGKLYAKEAGLAATDDVGNKELINELGIPEGSLLPWLKDLREKKKIKQVKRGRYTHHSISLNVVEKALTNIEKKLKKNI